MKKSPKKKAKKNLEDYKKEISIVSAPPHLPVILVYCVLCYYFVNKNTRTSLRTIRKNTK